jgi:hypothetical protein
MGRGATAGDTVAATRGATGWGAACVGATGWGATGDAATGGEPGGETGLAKGTGRIGEAAPVPPGVGMGPPRCG